MNVIYTTYNTNEMKFYTYENGIKYILKGLNEQSLNRFYVYKRNEEFNKLLNQWLTSKKKQVFFIAKI